MEKCVPQITRLGLCIGGALALLPWGALAQTAASDFWSGTHVRVGVAHLNPDTGSGTSFTHVQPAPLAGLGVDISKETLLYFSLAKDIHPQLEIELAAGLPPTSDIAVRVAPAFPAVLGQFDGHVLARVRQVAPNLYLNYKFGDAQSAWRPFVGLGVNYTRLSARSASAIGSNIGGRVHLHMGSSWGLAAQAGMSYRINDRWSAQASVATFRVKSRLTVRAGGVERSVTMRMNPVAAAAALSYSF